MKSNNFNKQAKAELTTTQLRQLYDILLESSVPFEATTSRASKGLCQVTLSCKDADLDYWQTTLENIGGRAYD